MKKESLKIYQILPVPILIVYYSNFAPLELYYIYIINYGLSVTVSVSSCNVTPLMSFQVLCSLVRCMYPLLFLHC